MPASCLVSTVSADARHQDDRRRRNHDGSGDKYPGPSGADRPSRFLARGRVIATPGHQNGGNHQQDPQTHKDKRRDQGP